jgi:hypothetical protein
MTRDWGKGPTPLVEWQSSKDRRPLGGHRKFATEPSEVRKEKKDNSHRRRWREKGGVACHPHWLTASVISEYEYGKQSTVTHQLVPVSIRCRHHSRSVGIARDKELWCVLSSFPPSWYYDPFVSKDRGFIDKRLTLSIFSFEV